MPHAFHPAAPRPVPLAEVARALGVPDPEAAVAVTGVALSTADVRPARPPCGAAGDVPRARLCTHWTELCTTRLRAMLEACP